MLITLSDASLGLGKTIQVISFLAHLKEQGGKGPHLIVVPYVHNIHPTPFYSCKFRSSTLENWCREFARFAPSIEVQTYYADKNQRPLLRQTLLDSQRCRSKTSEGWEVLITTYNLAQGDDRDRSFFRKINWDVRLLPVPSRVWTDLLYMVVLRLRRRTCPQKFPITAVSISPQIWVALETASHGNPPTK